MPEINRCDHDQFERILRKWIFFFFFICRINRIDYQFWVFKRQFPLFHTKDRTRLERMCNNNYKTYFVNHFISPMWLVLFFERSLAFVSLIKFGKKPQKKVLKKSRRFFGSWHVELTLVFIFIFFTFFSSSMCVCSEPLYSKLTNDTNFDGISLCWLWREIKNIRCVAAVRF